MFTTADVATNLLHFLIFAGANAIFVYAIVYRLRLASKAQAVSNLASIEARIRSVLLNVLFQQKLYKHPVRGLMHGFIFYGFVVYALHTTSQMVAGNAWVPLKAAGLDPYNFWITDYTFLQKMSGGVLATCLVGSVAAIVAVFAVYKNLKVGKSFDAEKSPGAQWAFLLILVALAGGALALTFGSGTHMYEAVVQHFSLLVLTGLGFFAARRWIRRREELDIPSPASFIVITMIATLMLSTLASGTAQALLSGGGTSEKFLSLADFQRALAHPNWITAYVAGPILYLLGMDSVGIAEGVRNFSWWLHIVTVYAFMVYVPTSKHSHLIFAPINYFMIKDRPRGQLSMVNLEAENAVWGAGNVTQLQWTSLIDGLSCIECGRCTIECPANRTGKPLNPKRIMTEIKHALLDHAGEILAHDGTDAAPSRVIGDPYITDEELWGCTTCYACVEACPVGNNQVEAIIEMRRNLVLVESRFSSELQLAFQNMENNSNPWGIGAHTRADWCQDLGVKTLAENPNVDVLYWVGCAGSFDERNKKIARSFVKILQKAEVSFGILGTEENCTGDSARRGGNEYLYQTLAQTNIQTLNGYNVKKIVTACPHCYNTLKNEYPQMGGNYDVQHHSDFIDDLLRDGRIEMDPAAVEGLRSRRSVYHDSCYLGRYNDVYEQPRTLVRNALGMDPAEASDHHKTSLCCGAGGAQMWMEETHERVNVARTQQLLDTGADTIATACPFCITMITDGVKAGHMQDDVKVLDVAELVETSMVGGGGAIGGGFEQRKAVGAGH